MVDNWDEAKYEWDNEPWVCEPVLRVNSFSIVLMVFWGDARITVEEILQSVIVRIHDKACGLVVVGIL